MDDTVEQPLVVVMYRLSLVPESTSARSWIFDVVYKFSFLYKILFFVYTSCVNLVHAKQHNGSSREAD